VRAFDSGGLHTTAAPPSVNVGQVAGSEQHPETAWVGQVDQRCLSLFFHARLSGSHLAIELRAGSHLLSADDSLALVAGAMTLIRG
jgi:hypothetical protein